MKQEFTPIRWAVPDMVPEGLTVLAGKPKLGKSWLALSLGLAVASGGQALGKLKCAAGPVLYLALEDTRRRLQDRLNRLLEKQQTPAPETLSLATTWPRQDQKGLDYLATWLDAHQNTRLVIIDTWAKFRPAPVIVGSEYQTDYRQATEVKALSDKYGVAILAIHHCRKMAAADPLEEVSGTLGLTGAADAVLVLRRDRGQHDATLHAMGRDIEEAEMALSFNPDYCTWSLVGDAATHRLSKERQAVLDLLSKSGALTPSQAAPLLEKQTPATKKLLWAMEQAGQLVKDGSGRYSAVTGNPVTQAQMNDDWFAGEVPQSPFD